VRALQGTHLKGWSLLEVIRTDIFQRGVPWMLLLRRSRIAESDLNVSLSQKVCVAATGASGIAAVAAAWAPVLLCVPALSMVAILTLNRDFYHFLARRRGWAFAAGSLPLHLVYFACCGASVLIALAISRFAASEPQAAPQGRRADLPAAPRPHPVRSRRAFPWTRS